MLLWCVFNGGNYRYLIEYGFADDGVITCRVGATARNHHPRQANDNDVHLHVGCWMFDPDLGDPTTPDAGGPEFNVVRIVRRLQRNPGTPNGLFRVDVRPFNASPTGEALEGSALWTPEEFTALRIESKARQNRSDAPQQTAYDVVPIRVGSVRHFPTQNFEFVNKDFWVTRQATGPVRYINVPSYVGSPPRVLDGKPVTIWHNSPLWHVPRGEDYGLDGRSNTTGVALTAWAGFMLKPRNLFDSTPFYGP
jgi:Cu2+-containing amine oxidase